MKTRRRFSAEFKVKVALVAISKSIRAECVQQVEALQNKHNITPGLAVILVGADAVSHIYVRNKMRAVEEVGLMAQLFDPSDVAPETICENRLAFRPHPPWTERARPRRLKVCAV